MVGWPCHVCTFLNSNPDRTRCEICETPRKAPVESKEDTQGKIFALYSMKSLILALDKDDIHMEDSQQHDDQEATPPVEKKPKPSPKPELKEEKTDDKENIVDKNADDDDAAAAVAADNDGSTPADEEEEELGNMETQFRRWIKKHKGEKIPGRLKWKSHDDEDALFWYLSLSLFLSFSLSLSPSTCMTCSYSIICLVSYIKRKKFLCLIPP